MRYARPTARAAEGHSKAMCPSPPQQLQMTTDTQSRLMCPGWPQFLQMMSRKGPPTICDAIVVLGH